jgi:hypothetical protein
LAFPLKLCGVTRSGLEVMKEARDDEDRVTNIGKKRIIVKQKGGGTG